MEKYKLTVVYDGGFEKEHYFEAELNDVKKVINIFELAFENGVNASLTVPGKNSNSVINARKVLECTFERIVE